LSVRALVVLAALAALVVAGCGGSSSSRKGPPALLYVSTQDDDYAIFGADADGKHSYRLTKEKGDASTPQGLFFQTSPAWSPDGKLIAFVSRRDGPGHIFVMNADGTGTRRVTTGPMEDDHPSWSADGKKIVFGREGALFVVPSAGGPAKRVGKGFGNAADPAWSPDGKHIAYDYRRPGFNIREIWLMNPDGTGIRKLTNLGAKSALPAWSPDGSKIAYESDAAHPGGPANIFMVRLVNGQSYHLSSSDIDEIQPTWAPDGDTVTFARDGSLWNVRLNNDAKLTEGPNDSAPAWNPHPPK
jgi:Tol biopolymer transport system component